MQLLIVSVAVEYKCIVFAIPMLNINVLCESAIFNVIAQNIAYVYAIMYPQYWVLSHATWNR